MDGVRRATKNLGWLFFGKGCERLVRLSLSSCWRAFLGFKASELMPSPSLTRRCSAFSPTADFTASWFAKWRRTRPRHPGYSGRRSFSISSCRSQSGWRLLSWCSLPCRRARCAGPRSWRASSFSPRFVFFRSARCLTCPLRRVLRWRPPFSWGLARISSPPFACFGLP